MNIYKELNSLEYEVENNSCRRIGEERYKRINQEIGLLKGQIKTIEELRKIWATISVMENADDRIPYPDGIKISILDGGSVKRFSTMKLIEERMKELMEGK